MVVINSQQLLFYSRAFYNSNQSTKRGEINQNCQEINQYSCLIMEAFTPTSCELKFSWNYMSYIISYLFGCNNIIEQKKSKSNINILTFSCPQSNFIQFRSIDNFQISIKGNPKNERQFYYKSCKVHSYTFHPLTYKYFMTK